MWLSMKTTEAGLKANPACCAPCIIPRDTLYSHRIIFPNAKIASEKASQNGVETISDRTLFSPARKSDKTIRVYSYYLV